MPHEVTRRFELAYGVADHLVGIVMGETDESGYAEDFFDDEEFLLRAASPHKTTLLHDFIRHVHAFCLDYATGHEPDLELDYFEKHFTLYNQTPPPWLNRDEIHAHIWELDKLLAGIVPALARDVFHILFGDRKFLLRFQEIVAKRVSNLLQADYPQVLEKDGVLQRTSRLPVWLKRGVFFRDQGTCQSCHKDLSGLVRVCNDVQLDHIVPLARGGTNDPSNFQLMCEECNKAKGGRAGFTSERYCPFWEEE